MGCFNWEDYTTAINSKEAYYNAGGRITDPYDQVHPYMQAVWEIANNISCNGSKDSSGIPIPWDQCDSNNGLGFSSVSEATKQAKLAQTYARFMITGNPDISMLKATFNNNAKFFMEYMNEYFRCTDYWKMRSRACLGRRNCPVSMDCQTPSRIRSVFEHHGILPN